MSIVQCDMCFDLFNINEWKESDIFICQKCAEILSKIRQKEIQFGREFTEAGRLKIFKILRGVK